MDFRRIMVVTIFSFMLIFGWGCKATNGVKLPASSPAPSTSPSTPPTLDSNANGGAIHLTGILTYDFIPATNGYLNYAGVVQKPIRNVYVELLNAIDDSVIGFTITNEVGAYDFSLSTPLNVKLRIYAEMKIPSVVIQDNTNGDAEYVLVTPNYNITSSTVKNIRALSGWSGANGTGLYNGARVAAPFAILDSIYTISKKIQSIRSSIMLPQLKVNWSINNVSVSGNIAAGEIITTHYNSGTNQIYILGKADVDTDEYDSHVIVHEWGHFFENNLSRSDSFGGNHAFGDEKDMSLAFGEGWGNALSAIAFDPDAIYADTWGSRQQTGMRIDLESRIDTHKGWFSEVSVQEILYDIYDSTNETGDNLSLGLGPILDVLVGSQKTTPAATSIFSFIHGLKLLNPLIGSDLDTLLATKNIAPITSPYGSGEVNDGGWDKNLPVYNSLSLGGAAIPISLYGNYGQDDYYGYYNTVFNNKYLKFTATTSTTKLTVTATDTFEIHVYNKGVEVYTYFAMRSSAGAFGPYDFNFSTIAGQSYTVQILTSQDVIWADSIIALTVSGTAL